MVTAHVYLGLVVSSGGCLPATYSNLLGHTLLFINKQVLHVPIGSLVLLSFLQLFKASKCWFKGEQQGDLYDEIFDLDSEDVRLVTRSFLAF